MIRDPELEHTYVVTRIDDERGSRWECDVGRCSNENTVVFEGWISGGGGWVPINGQRISGPGQTSGAIYTNAVAGGPARFQGTAHGVDYIRARLTRWGDEKVFIKLVSGEHGFNGFIGEQAWFTYIIHEESTIEDLLNSS